MRAQYFQRTKLFGRVFLRRPHTNVLHDQKCRAARRGSCHFGKPEEKTFDVTPAWYLISIETPLFDGLQLLHCHASCGLLLLCLCRRRRRHGRAAAALLHAGTCGWRQETKSHAQARGSQTFTGQNKRAKSMKVTRSNTEAFRLFTF